LLTIPIIASGGVGKWEDIREAFLDGKADAALMASIFHFGQYTVSQLKKLLDETGIPIRHKFK
jgi:imidazole glycerol-phosphate synthase subunit HisF